MGTPVTTAGSPAALDENSSMPASDTPAQPEEEPSKSTKKSKEKSRSKEKAEKKSSILAKFAGRSKAFFSLVLPPSFTLQTWISLTFDIRLLSS